VPDIRQLNSSDNDFWQQLDEVLAWDQSSDTGVLKTVTDILADVKKRGDAAVLEYTQKFDGVGATSVAQLELSAEELNFALNSISKEQHAALEKAASRVREYAQHQKMESWSYTEEDGTLLGQKVTPMDRVGLYVPGGKAAYPSSVLMNAIPAKVAGVPELIMVVPTPNGETNIPKVDKITGPGNTYVATAKRLVFGVVGIDMIAGPSEILVVCDGKTDPDWIAMDLFSQAEHDELAQSILVCPDAAYIEQVKSSVEKLIADMPRKDIISESLTNRAAMILVKDLDEAIEVANHIAPEHLELSIDDADKWAEKIRHAGAIFMGRYTAEALGDYCAGPNHVLPTSGTARFSSPLGVYDFQKRTSLINCSEQGASDLGKVASTLAHGEGLTAHARSAEYRILKDE